MHSCDIFSKIGSLHLHTLFNGVNSLVGERVHVII